MKENRKTKRCDSIKIVFVFNKESFIGYLDDISLDGMKLMSDEPIPLEKDFQVYIEIGSEKIKFESRSVWEEADKDSNHYYTGFKFLQLAPEALTQIQNLMNELEEADF